MNIVEPIRDIKTLNKIRQALREYSEKYYLIFEYGITTGLRISDVLNLTVDDIKLKDFVEIKEKKTKKTKKFKLKEELKQDLLKYIDNSKIDKYIFATSWYKCDYKPITRCQFYKVLNRGAKKVGYNQKIGTHSMRKTFGYHFYKQTHDIVLLQKIFNHSTPSVTLRYIGISQDMIDKAYSNFDYNSKGEMFATNENILKKIVELENKLNKVDEVLTECMNYGFKKIEKKLKQWE